MGCRQRLGELRRRHMFAAFLLVAALTAASSLLLWRARPKAPPPPPPPPPPLPQPPAKVAFETEGVDGRAAAAPAVAAPPAPRLVVHIDMKGSPPTLKYLRQLLDKAADQGADGVLLEYEDMFPFEGKLANLSARNAYGKAELSRFLQWAAARGLAAIPLVQTFGHLEYALKLAEWAHLRELRAFPQELCPSEPQSMELVSEMLRQVMALHAAAAPPRHLHIGCDEVRHLKACVRCSGRRLGARQLLVEHVTRVAQHVRKAYPGVQPLMWDDMLRSFRPDELRASGLGRLVTLVVWAYTESIASLVPHRLWYTYTTEFPEVWGAAAYRGASGEQAALPHLPERLANVLAWRERLRGPAPLIPAALVLTGWARYDHFAVLCEPLPAAAPSLLLALMALNAPGPARLPPARRGRLLHSWRSALLCSRTVRWRSLEEDPRQSQLQLCAFPGAAAFAAVLRCEQAAAAADAAVALQERASGWLTPYNTELRFASPQRLLEAMRPLQSLAADLASCRREGGPALQELADEHAAREWLRQRVRPAELRLARLREAADGLLQQDLWPRRPLAD